MWFFSFVFFFSFLDIIVSVLLVSEELTVTATTFFPSGHLISLSWNDWSEVEIEQEACSSKYGFSRKNYLVMWCAAWCTCPWRGFNPESAHGCLRGIACPSDSSLDFTEGVVNLNLLQREIFNSICFIKLLLQTVVNGLQVLVAESCAIKGVSLIYPI